MNRNQYLLKLQKRLIFKFARDIAPEKNFRQLLVLLCAIPFVLSRLLFWTGNFDYSLPSMTFISISLGIIVPGAAILWLVLGIDCLWDSCYNSDALYWGASLLFLLGTVYSLIKILHGQFQYYFTMLQTTGILFSLVGYNRYLSNMDDFLFYKYPFFMTPYIICLVTAVVSFFILDREVGHGRSN